MSKAVIEALSWYSAQCLSRMVHVEDSGRFRSQPIGLPQSYQEVVDYWRDEYPHFQAAIVKRFARVECDCDGFARNMVTYATKDVKMDPKNVFLMACNVESPGKPYDHVVACFNVDGENWVADSLTGFGRLENLPYDFYQHCSWDEPGKWNRTVFEDR